MAQSSKDLQGIGTQIRRGVQLCQSGFWRICHGVILTRNMKMFVSALAFFGALFMTWNPTDQFDPPTGGLNEAKSGGKIPTSATLQSVASQMWTENVPDQMQSKEQEKDWNGGGGGVAAQKLASANQHPPLWDPNDPLRVVTLSDMSTTVKSHWKKAPCCCERERERESLCFDFGFRSNSLSCGLP